VGPDCRGDLGCSLARRYTFDRDLVRRLTPMIRVRYGRYETLQLIASGGMASVYVGRAQGPAGFERLVAVKVMHDHIADDPDFSGMFLDEARLAAKIRHPNVVPTLDVAEDGKFIVMELVEGASLRHVMRNREDTELGPLPLPIALRIMIDTLEGLHAAHELKMVHRDVSPHNILVGVDGISRITDFGIAYAEERLTTTREGQLKGKLPYMAPEQLENADVDRRVDVYAGGCVLWEMLTGERLFVAKHEVALVKMKLKGPRCTIRELNADVPDQLDRACMLALRDADERYATAAAFAEALEQAAMDAGVHIARPRDVGTITDGVRVSLPAETRQALIDGAATTLPESRPAWAISLPSADGDAGVPSSQHTGTMTAPHDELPLAARPVRVSSSDSQERQSLEQQSAADDPRDPNTGSHTSASLVTPVNAIMPSSGRPMLAVLAAAVVAVSALGWLALRSPAGAEPQSSAEPTSASAAAVPAPASSATTTPEIPSKSAAASSATSSASPERSASARSVPARTAVAKPPAQKRRPIPKQGERSSTTGGKVPSGRTTLPGATAPRPSAKAKAAPAPTSTDSFHPPKL